MPIEKHRPLATSQNGATSVHCASLVQPLGGRNVTVPPAPPPLGGGTVPPSPPSPCATPQVPFGRQVSPGTMHGVVIVQQNWPDPPQARHLAGLSRWLQAMPGQMHSPRQQGSPPPTSQISPSAVH